MKILARLFRRKIQPVDDPVFGRIEFDRGVWTHIPKERRGFMVVVFAPESGPVDCQREFFKKLSGSVTEIIADAKRFTQASAPDVDTAALSLYSVEIGTEEEIGREAFVIELTDKEESPIHRVEFAEGKPSVYGCDD